jgi:hypothetical protein
MKAQKLKKYKPRVPVPQKPPKAEPPKTAYSRKQKHKSAQSPDE